VSRRLSSRWHIMCKTLSLPVVPHEVLLTTVTTKALRTSFVANL
jgi:hypothetical protein